MADQGKKSLPKRTGKETANRKAGNAPRVRVRKETMTAHQRIWHEAVVWAQQPGGKYPA